MELNNGSRSARKHALFLVLPVVAGSPVTEVCNPGISYLLVILHQVHHQHLLSVALAAIITVPAVSVSSQPQDSIAHNTSALSQHHHTSNMSLQVPMFSEASSAQVQATSLCAHARGGVRLCLSPYLCLGTHDCLHILRPVVFTVHV